MALHMPMTRQDSVLVRFGAHVEQPRPCRCLMTYASSSNNAQPRTRTAKKKSKELDLEHLRELAAERKIKVPFHSLHPEEGPQQTLLEKADHNLHEYCSTLPGDERAERCWQAVRYFEERKAEAEAGCVLPSGERARSSEACTSLERLEDLVRQFVGQAPTHMFVQTLLVLDAADRHAAERARNQEADVAVQGEEEVRRQRLANLFYAMDTDLNGVLDVEEFREAMRQADRELSGSVVSKVLENMDVHGRLTLDQFLAIVEAEEIVSNTPLAAWLRRSYSKDESSWTTSD